MSLGRRRQVADGERACASEILQGRHPGMENDKDLAGTLGLK